MVCDVNGWSFVKGNQKYYNDCATLIRKHLLDECGVQGVDTSTMMILGPEEEKLSEMGEALSYEDYSMRESLVNRSPERLRSVIVVMRHGDRRPKEKMKFKTKMAPILEYFDQADPGVAEVKLKTPEELAGLKQRFDLVANELRGQLKKLQSASMMEEDQKKNAEKVQAIQEELLNIDLLIPVLEMKDRFSGLERKVQLKASKWKQEKDEECRKVAQVVVVAKWGGELTVSGLAQAKELGRRLRHDLYPNDPTGLLRLHSSFRHDFKIYSSQEGRCQITAAAFTKGFLDLDGDIIPILVSLVTRESYAQGLLDEPIPKKQRDTVKQKIESLLLSYANLASSDVMQAACPTEHQGLKEAARRIGSPLQLLHTIRYLSMEYIDSIAEAKDLTYQEMKRHSAIDETPQDEHEQEDCQDDAVPLGKEVPAGPGVQIPEDLKDTCKRKWLHLRRKEHRWRKLFNGFVRMKESDKGMKDDENITYDASKIPDVWDNLYYDMLTHRHYLGEKSCKIAEMMVGLLHPLNEWVCLSEFGISVEEKLRIGVDVTWRLIGKMLNDLEFMIEDDVGTIDEAGQHSANKQDGIPRSLSGVSASSRRVSLGGGGHGVGSAAGLAALAPRGAGGADMGPRSIAGAESCSIEIGSPPPNSGHGPASLSDGGEAPPVVNGPASEDLDAAMPDLPEAPRAWKEWATAASSVPPSDAGSVRPSSPPPVDTLMEKTSDGDDVSMPLADTEGRKPSKLNRTKLTPGVRDELKKALRDSSDWHPRLNDQVAELTDIKCTRIVRSRIYVTSASTMHSLFNILRHGQSSSSEDNIVSNLGNVMDLNYLTHLVLRCYERDEPKDDCASSAPLRQDEDGLSLAERQKNKEKARYRVEISMSPGVQVYTDNKHVPWPKGSELSEKSCMVAPLQIIGDSIDLMDLERFLAGVVKEYGPSHEEEEDDQDEDRQSGD